MKFWRRRNRKALILAFATVAVAAPIAQASSSYEQTALSERSAFNSLSTTQSYPPQALRALTLRSEAMNARYTELASVRALQIRSQALNQKFQTLAVRPDDRSGTLGVGSTTVVPDRIDRWLAVQKFESQSSSTSVRPDDKAGIRGQSVVVDRTPQLVSVGGDSFSWRDAGIGAGTALAATLLLLSSFMVTRRRQGDLAH